MIDFVMPQAGTAVATPCGVATASAHNVCKLFVLAARIVTERIPQIWGPNGMVGGSEHLLDNSKNNFERGKTDTFVLEVPKEKDCGTPVQKVGCRAQFTSCLHACLHVVWGGGPACVQCAIDLNPDQDGCIQACNLAPAFLFF